jgi:exopolyphosphatase
MKAFAERCAATARARAAATVVVGNEAGDMDSVVGSFYLAYLVEQLVQRNLVPYKLPISPMITFPHSDLGLRNDVVKTLEREGGILPAAVVSCVQGDMDELGSQREHQSFVPLTASPSVDSASVLADADVLLFDHNKPHAAVGGVSRVVGVVDHHADEQLLNAETMRSRGQLCVIAPAGSACTHLVHLFMKYKVPVPDPRLLFAPILLDTMNFDPLLKKTTVLDEEARQFLLHAIDSPFDAKAMFEELVALKFDVSGLTIPQNLRRDYKKFAFTLADGRPCVVGISSVLLLRQQVETIYGDRERWINGVTAFARKDSCDAFLVMFCAEQSVVTGPVSTSGMIRQLAVLGSKDFVTAVGEFAQQREHAFIGLEPVGSPAASESDSLVYADYNQHDYATSRKALTPLFSAFLSKSVSKI